MNQDYGPLLALLQNAAFLPSALQTPFFILCTVLPMTTLCALAGLPFMAVAAQAVGQVRQRSFYTKAARQLAALALVQGWVCTFAGALVLWQQLAYAEQYPVLMQGYMVWWGLVAVCTLCISLYVVLWKSLRDWQLFHQCLGLVGGCLGAIVLYAGLNLVGTEQQIALGLSIGTNMWELFVPQEESPLWAILYFLPPLALSLSAGLGALWLLARRKREDYGRDHYNTMLPWCAVWARNAWGVVWLVLLAMSIMDFIQVWNIAPESAMPQELALQALYQLMWAAPALLWFVVARSKMPLRHTLTLVLAQVIAMGFTLPLAATLQ